MHSSHGRSTPANHFRISMRTRSSTALLKAAACALGLCGRCSMCVRCSRPSAARRSAAHIRLQQSTRQHLKQAFRSRHRVRHCQRLLAAEWCATLKPEAVGTPSGEAPLHAPFSTPVAGHHVHMGIAHSFVEALGDSSQGTRSARKPRCGFAGMSNLLWVQDQAA